MATKICPICGKEFGHTEKPSRLNKTVYCSRECWKASCQHTQRCQCCGKEFTTTKSHAKKYCSHKCASKGLTIKTERLCPTCGKVFLPSRPEGQYCSKKCGSQKPYNKGTSKPVTYVCLQCGVLFTGYPSRKAKFCSMECAGEYLSHNRWGDKHPRYKGGKIKSRGRNWGHQSKLALERDGYQCQICHKVIGRHKWDYGIHHIIPYRTFNGDYEQANQLSNLVSLCHSCHTKVEFGKLACPRPLL